jgi:hypothetical protein
MKKIKKLLKLTIRSKKKSSLQSSHPSRRRKARRNLRVLQTTSFFCRIKKKPLRKTKSPKERERRLKRTQ